MLDVLQNKAGTKANSTEIAPLYVVVPSIGKAIGRGLKAIFCIAVKPTDFREIWAAITEDKFTRILSAVNIDDSGYWDVHELTKRGNGYAISKRIGLRSTEEVFMLMQKADPIPRQEPGHYSRAFQIK